MAQQVDQELSGLFSQAFGEDSQQILQQMLAHESDAVGVTFGMAAQSQNVPITKVVRLEKPTAVPGQDKIAPEPVQVAFNSGTGMQMASVDSVAESFQVAGAFQRPPVPDRELRYHIRNVNQTLQPAFLKEVHQLLNGKQALSDTHLNSLLGQAIKSHGVISEEEIKLLSALTVPANVKHFLSQGIPPKSQEYAFTGVPESKMTALRQRAMQHPANQSDYAKDSLTDRLVRQNPQLQPFLNAINDESLTLSQRRKMIEDYRGNEALVNAQLVAAVLDNDFLSSGMMRSQGVKNTAPFLYDPNDKAGIYGHLVHEAQRSPMTEILMDITGYINSQSHTLVNPLDLFKKATAMAAKQGIQDPGEQRRYALRAITTITSFVHGAQFPPKFQGLQTNLLNAYKNLHERSIGGGSIVMSHDVRATPPSGSGAATTFDTTRDNNFHFFYHAYVASELVQNEYAGQTAMDISARLGAIYELDPEQLRDAQGNASIKDIVMNAYGAQFGVLMAQGNFQKIDDIFPNFHEGPQVENERDF